MSDEQHELHERLLAELREISRQFALKAQRIRDDYAKGGISTEENNQQVDRLMAESQNASDVAHQRYEVAFQKLPRSAVVGDVNMPGKLVGAIRTYWVLQVMYEGKHAEDELKRWTLWARDRATWIREKLPYLLSLPAKRDDLVDDLRAIES
jgi:hypothetical protein